MPVRSLKGCSASEGAASEAAAALPASPRPAAAGRSHERPGPSESAGDEIGVRVSAAEPAADAPARLPCSAAFDCCDDRGGDSPAEGGRAPPTPAARTRDGSGIGGVDPTSADSLAPGLPPVGGNGVLRRGCARTPPAILSGSSSSDPRRGRRSRSSDPVAAGDMVLKLQYNSAVRRVRAQAE